MFADDTKVFRTIKTNDDHCILQDDLDELTAWSTKWLLTFHPDKCKVMHLGKPLEEQFKYTLYDGSIIHELGYTSEEKDIGVIIDSNLEFDKHVCIYFNVNKANSTMAVIRRSFQKLDGDTFVPLYKALVRTHLDYACCIWSPYKQKYKDALENVQRRATKLINGMSEMSYPDRVRKLKLPTLAYRRIRGDMIELYKLIHGNYDRNTPNIINLFKDHNKLNERTRGHMRKICHERSRLNLRKESFPNRAVTVKHVEFSSRTCFECT